MRRLETLLAEIVEVEGPQPVVIDYAGRYAPPRNDRFEIRYPCTGSVGHMGIGYSSNGNHHELTFHGIAESDDDLISEKLEQALATLEAELQQQVHSTNEQIDRERQELATAVLPVLEARWKKVRVLRGALAALNIPLEKSTLAALLIPARPARLSLTAVTAAASAGQQE